MNSYARKTLDFIAALLHALKMELSAYGLTLLNDFTGVFVLKKT